MCCCLSCHNDDDDYDDVGERREQLVYNIVEQSIVAFISEEYSEYNALHIPYCYDNNADVGIGLSC